MSDLGDWAPAPPPAAAPTDALLELGALVVRLAALLRAEHEARVQVAEEHRALLTAHRRLVARVDAWIATGEPTEAPDVPLEPRDRVH